MSTFKKRFKIFCSPRIILPTLLLHPIKDPYWIHCDYQKWAHVEESIIPNGEQGKRNKLNDVTALRNDCCSCRCGLEVPSWRRIRRDSRAGESDCSTFCVETKLWLLGCSFFNTYFSYDSQICFPTPLGPLSSHRQHCSDHEEYIT